MLDRGVKVGPRPAFHHPVPTGVIDGAAAQEVVRRAIAEAVARLQHLEPLIRAGRDPEAIHQARVATRKLRSHLRTFAPLLEPEWTDGLREQVGVLAQTLGEVRDREVLLARLRDRARSLPKGDQRSAAALLRLLEVEVDDARRRLDAEMSSRRYAQLVDRLVAAAHAPVVRPEAGRPAADVMPALAAAPWRRLRAAVRALPAAPADGDLHRVRILAKRARYAAEAVAAVSAPGADSFARALARLQTVLGEHQDSVTAQAWLRTAWVGGRHAGVAAELSAMERTAAAGARAEWPNAWRAVERKRPRR